MQKSGVSPAVAVIIVVVVLVIIAVAGYFYLSRRGGGGGTKEMPATYDEQATPDQAPAQMGDERATEEGVPEGIGPGG